MVDPAFEDGMFLNLVGALTHNDRFVFGRSLNEQERQGSRQRGLS